jgi:membrane protein
MMTRFFAFVRQVYGNCVRNNTGLMAAAISYYTLVSLIPLLLLACAAFGILLRLGQFQGDPVGETAQVVQVMLPLKIDEIKVFLQGVQHSYVTTGPLGLVLLIWFGSQFFHSMEEALNRTWEAPRSRPFWRGRLIGLGVMALVGPLGVASFILSSVAVWVQTRTLPGMSQPLSHIPYIWGAVPYIVSLLVSIVTFVLIYRIIPNTKVTWRETFVGGVFAGALWELAKVAFGYYLTFFGTRGYDRLYGSLTNLAVLVVWVYYTSYIFVIGGEVARAWCRWSTAVPPGPVGRGLRAARDRIASATRGKSKRSLAPHPPRDRRTEAPPKPSRKRRQ